MKILIVDDSAAYRSQIRAALDGQDWIEIAGTAANGQQALDFMERTPVDLVTLDMEMPVLGGVETLREIRRRKVLSKVIMFSSSTVRGSEATLEALANGADDFVAKPSLDAATSQTPFELIRTHLLPKLQQFRRTPAPFSAGAATTTSLPGAAPVPGSVANSVAGSSVVGNLLARAAAARKVDLSVFNPSVLVIASSTGGPGAHDVVWKQLSGELKIPVLIAQHMPPIFTAAFAKRIHDASGLPCREVKNEEILGNEIYVAPGDFHFEVRRTSGQLRAILHQGPQRNSVRPAADHLFESAAQVFGNRCLGIVMTGMGEDGAVGAQAIKSANGGVAIQTKETCVVFGMPGAVQAAGNQDGELDLNGLAALIRRVALK